jgi:hypothetical protein
VSDSFPPSTGFAEARTTLEPSLYTIQTANQAASFFNPCLQVNASVGVNVTFVFGPYLLGTPCDFAHASPVSTPILASVDIDATSGPFGIDVSAIFTPNVMFYDSQGNSVSSSYTFQFRPDLPEPSTALLLAVGLAVIGARRVCKMLRALRPDNRRTGTGMHSGHQAQSIRRGHDW